MGPTSTQPATAPLFTAAGHRESVHHHNPNLPNPRGGRDSGPVRAAMADPPVKPFKPTGEAMPRIMLNGGLTSLSLPPDGRAVLVGTEHSFMYHVSLADMSARALREGHRGPVLGLSFPPDHSDIIVSCSSDGSVRTWALNTFSQLACGTINVKDITAASVAAEATCVAVQGDVAISGWSGEAHSWGPCLPVV